jgi:flagellar basal-body rod protein FlgG
MSTRALRTAASGMYAQQINIEVISNNMANMNTTGFKKNKAEFQDLMYQDVPINPITTQTPGIKETSSDTIQIGTGVQPSSTQKIFLQGDLVNTNNKFDIAVQGDGFFQVRKPDGNLVYTRDGSFKVNADGKLVTANGCFLEPEITVGSDSASVTISQDGVVEVVEANGKARVVGEIQVARFMNPGGMQALGDNLYGETTYSGTAILGTPGANGFGSLHQGYLESSNVDVVEEMIAMIAAQRAYEINSKTVQTVENMMSIANNLKRT